MGGKSECRDITSGRVSFWPEVAGEVVPELAGSELARGISSHTILKNASLLEDVTHLWNQGKRVGQGGRRTHAHT